MIIDKKYFFDSVRQRLFNNNLNATQVQGTEYIIDHCPEVDPRFLAYMLATTFHETAKTMQPITEYGKPAYFKKYEQGKLKKSLGNTQPGDGERFKGRGFVMITGRANYTRFGDLLEIDLVGNPEKACELEVAFDIMVIGMVRGLFTGKRLYDYFNAKEDNWLGARRIINGTDRAELCADYGQKFFDAIHEIKQ
jgi:putative chitinase